MHNFEPQIMKITNVETSKDFKTYWAQTKIEILFYWKSKNQIHAEKLKNTNKKHSRPAVNRQPGFRRKNS